MKKITILESVLKNESTCTLTTDSFHEIEPKIESIDFSEDTQSYEIRLRKEKKNQHADAILIGTAKLIICQLTSHYGLLI